jgi:hypothetical protein
MATATQYTIEIEFYRHSPLTPFAGKRFSANFGRVNGKFMEQEYHILSETVPSLSHNLDFVYLAYSTIALL